MQQQADALAARLGALAARGRDRGQERGILGGVLLERAADVEARDVGVGAAALARAHSAAP